MAIVYPEAIHRIHTFAVRARSLVPFADYPVHRNENYAPFFIIGSGRSGNTLLRRVLTAHPALHIPPETYVLGKVVKKFRTVSHLDWIDIVHFIYSYFQFNRERETWNITDFSELVDAVANVEKEKRSLALIINAFYEWHARQLGVEFERWGDKTPLNVYALRRLHQVFPDAQFIHIIRDGCDAVASYLEAGIYDDVEQAAWRWRTAVDLCRRFGRGHPLSYREVRYEDLVTKPRETVVDVCAFLGVPFDSDMLRPPEDPTQLGDVPRARRHSQVLKPISANQIGKGRQSLSTEQKRLIGAIIGRQMAELGYPDCVHGRTRGEARLDTAGGPRLEQPQARSPR